MRCEICNKSMTEPHLDGEGKLHNYCPVCADEIEEVIFEYDMDDDEWWDEGADPWVVCDELLYGESEDYQGLGYGPEDFSEDDAESS